MTSRPSGRSFARACGVALVAVLAATLAIRIYGRHRLAAAEARIGEALAPFTENDIASPNVPDGENAAIPLRAGALALIEFGNDKPLVADLGEKPVSKWTESEKRALASLLEKNAPALELLHRGAALPRSSYGIKANSFSVSNPLLLRVDLPLFPLINAARLCLVDAESALGERDDVRCLRSAAAIAAIARSLQVESPLNAKLIAVACERMLLRLVHDAVADPGSSRDLLGSLRGLIATSDLRAEWRRTRASERFVETTPEARAELIRLVAHSYVRGWIGRATELVFGDLARAEFDTNSTSVADAVGRPLGTLSADEREGRTIRSSWFDPISPWQLPNLNKAAGRFQATLSQRRLAVVALRLRQDAWLAGGYPASLAGIAEAAAQDPFTGGSLRYQRRPDGSAVLEVRGAEKLWKDAYQDVVNPCPFTWELPAPRVATSASSR
jgi:hypothetical protein